MIRLVRRSAKASASAKQIDLPANAFQVRISIIRMNIIGVLLTAATLAAAVFGFRLIWGPTDTPSALFIPYLIILVVLHELSHGLGWILCGIPIRTIKFGIMWHLLAPYAHCRIPMSMRVYRFALLLPAFTTGIFPLVIGLWTQDFDLTLASTLLVGGAAGDISMLFAGIAFHRHTRVMDHPAEPAFVVLDKGNIAPRPYPLT